MSPGAGWGWTCFWRRWWRRSDFGRAVSRILSAPLRAERIICLSGRYPEPVRLRGTEAGRFEVPYLALHPTGFALPRCLRFARCALTAPFHPYPHVATRAVCSLWHCPSGSLAASAPACISAETELRGVAPCGVRTFLPGTRAPERSSALPKSWARYGTRWRCATGENGGRASVGASHLLAGGDCRTATTPSAQSGRNEEREAIRCAAGSGATRRSATSFTTNFVTERGARTLPFRLRPSAWPEAVRSRTCSPCRART